MNIFSIVILLVMALFNGAAFLCHYLIKIQMITQSF